MIWLLLLIPLALLLVLFARASVDSGDSYTQVDGTVYERTRRN